jgi:hypothetical protein
MPDIVGETVEGARAVLNRHRFPLAAVDTIRRFDVPARAVVSQTPAAGAPAAEGTAVEIVVNRRLLLEEQSQTIRTPRGVFISRRAPFGFLNSVYRAEFDRFGRTHPYITGVVYPGKRFSVLAPPRDHARLMIYRDAVLVDSRPLG